MTYNNLTDDDIRGGHIGDGLLRTLLISLIGVSVTLIAALCLYNI
jgi:hypothetical protein